MNEEDKDNINTDNKEDGTENGEKQSQDELTPDEGQKSPSSNEQSGEVARNNEEKKQHEVIHKKDGRLHIYIRQDKYKGELKSKNWVGRLYIDGKHVFRRDFMLEENEHKDYLFPDSDLQVVVKIEEEEI